MAQKPPRTYWCLYWFQTLLWQACQEKSTKVFCKVPQSVKLQEHGLWQSTSWQSWSMRCGCDCTRLLRLNPLLSLPSLRKIKSRFLTEGGPELAVQRRENQGHRMVDAESWSRGQTPRFLVWTVYRKKWAVCPGWEGGECGNTRVTQGWGIRKGSLEENLENPSPSGLFYGWSPELLQNFSGGIQPDSVRAQARKSCVYPSFQSTSATWEERWQCWQCNINHLNKTQC